MKTKRWMSALLALALMICLLPTTAWAVESATIEYTVEPGKSYRLTNSNPNEDYWVRTTMGEFHYDKAEYRSDGSADYAKDDWGQFLLNKGGYTDITGSRDTGAFYIPYEWSQFITVAEINHSALDVYSVEVGTSYRLTNSNPNEDYWVRTTMGEFHYDKAEYRSDGSADYAKDDWGQFLLNKDGYTDITGSRDTGAFYIPYEWSQFITIMDDKGNVLNQASTQASAQISNQKFEYIYDTTDPGENVVLPVEKLETVTDPSTASNAVNSLTSSMTTEQKNSATGADLATLYAETAVAKAASKTVSSSDILINATVVADVAAEAALTLSAVENTLSNGGITTARELSQTVTLLTNETEITIRIDPDVLGTGVDKVCVETPGYVLTFKLSDLAPDLTDILTFKAAPANVETLSVKNAVDIEVPGGSMAASITVSLPTDKSTDTTYQAVISSNGTTVASKYNPATTDIDGKVNTSGTYSVKTNEMDFTDITDKSTEMQKAIKYLAAHGIVMGSGGANYSPNDSISRAELTALVLRALGKVDSKATTSFTDVTTANWYYATAASSQKLGYINGFEDNTFRGSITINKEQIVAIAARVLGAEMNYKTPSNPAAYLSKYSDTVVSWAQPQVALATKENLVVYRTDGTFSGAKNMTRGDAAIIIYRLFQRIW